MTGPTSRQPWDYSALLCVKLNFLCKSHMQLRVWEWHRLNFFHSSQAEKVSFISWFFKSSSEILYILTTNL